MTKQDDVKTGTLFFFDLPCHFTLINGAKLKIVPENLQQEPFHQKCDELSQNFDNLGWIFGKTQYDYNIAFYPSPQQGRFCLYQSELTLVVDIYLMHCMPKDDDGKYAYEYKDIHGFTAIDFMGSPVDSCFSPKCIVDREQSNRKRIVFASTKEYSKTFATIANGVECKLSFTVEIDRKDYDVDDTQLGELRSILRLEFGERQNLSMIGNCWTSVCSFLTFCLGQYNVTNLTVGLWDESTEVGVYGRRGLIDCFINCDKEDDIPFRYPAYYRFQIASLGNKVGNLFSLISNKKTRPILGFLPKSNTDMSINRNKIRDLCTALEVEYKYFEGELKDPNVDSLVELLKEKVREYRKENPDAIDDNAYSYIDSSLSVISRPARKKVCAIYFKYSEFIDKIHNYQSLVEEPVITTREQTEEDIGWIVKVRNNITHSTEIIESKVPNCIFYRLKIAVFCSILDRAGYEKEEMKQIIMDYTRGYIPQFLKIGG